MTESYSSYFPREQDRPTAEGVNDYLTGKKYANFKLDAARWHIGNILEATYASSIEDSDLALRILLKDAGGIGDKAVYNEIYEFEFRTMAPIVLKTLLQFLQNVEDNGFPAGNIFEELEPLAWETD